MSENSDMMYPFAYPQNSSSHPSIQTQHIVSLLPTKLNRNNYILWKDLFLPILKGYDLIGIVDGSKPCPPQFLTTTTKQTSTASPQQIIENPSFVLWNKKDLSCKIIINASLTESIRPHTVASNTSRDLWLNLEKRFSSTTKSYLFSLKTKIQTLKKGSLSILEYLQLIKQTADAFATAYSPLVDIDFVAHVLNGLPPEYDAFATYIWVRSETVNAKEFHGLLLSKEMALSNHTPTLSEPQTIAFHTISSKPNSQHPHPSPYNNPN
ncbi:uncharacterized protein LOC110750676 [Prunus avium]|uniref:Uncharacterized protein LOC110750676 n=1 Tax=Prunus avium TaxID=42229 RepID=A0A6P5RZY3_PRUAV|nr:uncharacterized protein LOC110750676 [Prunus avium]